MTILSVLSAVFGWVKDHKAATAGLLLAAALGVAHVQLWALRDELTTAQAQVTAAKAYESTLEDKIDTQTDAIQKWHLAAQDAQAEAAKLRAAAEDQYQAELGKAKVLLERPKDSITCPQAWDRLFQALQGIHYAETP